MTAAYRLARPVCAPSLFERAADLGGLVGAFDFDGHRVDRFYHVVLPADDRVLGLADELGLGDRFRFRPTKVGFYDDGRAVLDDLAQGVPDVPAACAARPAPPGRFVARCQLTKTHDDARRRSPLLTWLRGTCGRRAVERLWVPLLDSKFDGRYDDLPATYIWARTRRMSTTRDRGGREVMGWLDGGYQRLIDALADRIVALGGEVRTAYLRRPDRRHRDRSDRRRRRRELSRRSTPSSARSPRRRRVDCCSPELAAQAPDDHCRYLGVICLLLRPRGASAPTTR